MDYVPSMAAVAAAAKKSQPDDAAALARPKAVAPVQPAGLDLRPTYTLAPGTADAMLSLANVKTQAVSTAEFEARYVHASQITQAAAAVVTAPVVAPEPAKAISASNRNWIEDVRLENLPTRKVGADTIVQYDNPRVMAAWRAAFPDIPDRKFRGLTQADTNVKPDPRRLSSEIGPTIAEKNIFLLCDTENFKAFSESHPETHINWIPVENEEIVLFWPNDRLGDGAHASSVLVRSPSETDGD